MSIKIYEGIKLNISTVKEIYELKQYFRDLFINSTKSIIKENFTKEFCSLRDHALYHSKQSVENTEESKSSFRKVFREYYDFLKNLGYEIYERNPDIDGTLDINLFMSENNEILGIYSSEHSFQYNKEILNHPKIEDYHYQDQTDKPKDIESSEWSERRKIWLNALDNNILKIEIIDSMDIRNIVLSLRKDFNKEFYEIQEKIYEERLKNAAIDLISKDIYEEKYNDDKMTSRLKAFREARESEKIQEKMDYLRTLLPKHYKIEE